MIFHIKYEKVLHLNGDLIIQQLMMRPQFVLKAYALIMFSQVCKKICKKSVYS